MSNSTNMDVQVVVLAGGRGERIGAYERDVQKCLMLFEGRPILGYVLDSISEAFNSATVTFCVSFKADAVKEFVRKNCPKNIHPQFCYDNGTSRLADILRGLKHFDGIPFVTLAGDIIVESSSIYRTAYEGVLLKDVVGSVTLSPHLEEIDKHAVGRIVNGRVTELIDIPPQTLDSSLLRDMTIWGMGAHFYPFARENDQIGSISELMNQAIKQNLYIAGNLYTGNWIHFGYPDDINKRFGL